MEPKTKQSLLVTVVGVTLFVALLRLSDVLAFAAKLIDLVLPILAGGILALFINVPMTGLEKRLNRLFGKAKKQPSAKAIHLLSFFITLLGVVLVLVLALTLLIPELVQSFHSLYVQIEANIPRWTAYLNAQDADMGWLMNWLEGINWEQLLHKVTASIDTVLVNAVGAVSATVNIAITASFALIISVYMSLSTESLGHQARTLVCAYLKPAHAAGVLKFCRLFRQSFANFLTGQCSEAVILGVLMALAFSVFKIPYGSLVGVLTAICAIIPYVGALISCVVSVFLVLLVDPVLAVRCLIVYLAVQFVENQFIYPRVVGKSVGLSPLYTVSALSRCHRVTPAVNQKAVIKGHAGKSRCLRFFCKTAKCCYHPCYCGNPYNCLLFLKHFFHLCLFPFFFKSLLRHLQKSALLLIYEFLPRKVFVFCK